MSHIVNLFNRVVKAKMNGKYETPEFKLGTDVLTQPTLAFFQNRNSTTFFNLINGEEMLRIAPDGLYVRGVKVPQDEAEASAVCDAFVSWLRTTNFPL